MTYRLLHKSTPIRQIEIFLLMLSLFSCSEQSAGPPLRLWFDEPADKWTEALPVGNGRMGAMIYGGVPTDQIQFNEETLWTGAPHDYAREGAHQYLGEIRKLLTEGKQKEAQDLAMREFMSDPLNQKTYQAFGDLMLNFPGMETYTGYHRELDLREAVHTVTYESDGVKFTRKYFASYPDNAIVIRLTANKRGKLGFTMGFTSPHEEKSVNAEGQSLTLQVQVKDGALRGVARARIESDGTVTAEGGNLKVEGAREAVIYLVAATNYLNYMNVEGDPEAETAKRLDKVAGKGYDQLLAAHQSDYRKLFGRFDVGFEGNDLDSLPTNQRIIAFNEQPDDPGLLSLYVQYGRYLLISSSRKGSQPANLQGIWNDQLKPAWDSKWTVNINTEMNYWPAELTNLSECHEPLFSMVTDCSETGSATAREHYDAPGWVLHHNTDIWRGTAPINHSDHGIWVTGGAWLSLHFWERYLFTLDKTFLAHRAYPVMKGAAEFFTHFLVPDPETGYLISTPSNSPETGGLVAGPTMDHQIIRALFRACIEAIEILDTDHGFANELKEMLPRIVPNQIGKHGQLQEWVRDIDDPNNKHRHVSHLWGVHPGNEINWDETPDLMKAARQSLIYRGDEGTGWSLAWKINFWARFHDGNHAYQMVKMLFRPVEIDQVEYHGGGGSYANLFDAHPPFQIDGNFGAPAGIIEMLVQSHLGYIHLLPALPDALPGGNIRGVRARGGFELSFTWSEGKLRQVEVLSKAGQPCKLVLGDQKVEFDTTEGETYRFDGNLEPI